MRKPQFTHRLEMTTEQLFLLAELICYGKIYSIFTQRKEEIDELMRAIVRIPP